MQALIQIKLQFRGSYDIASKDTGSKDAELSLDGNMLGEGRSRLFP